MKLDLILAYRNLNEYIESLYEGLIPSWHRGVSKAQERNVRG